MRGRLEEKGKLSLKCVGPEGKKAEGRGGRGLAGGGKRSKGKGRASFEQGEGGRGFWTQNLVYQKWPDQIFPIVNSGLSRDGHFGLGRGGRGFWGEGSPSRLVFNYSKEALGKGG